MLSLTPVTDFVPRSRLEALKLHLQFRTAFFYRRPILSHDHPTRRSANYSKSEWGLVGSSFSTAIEDCRVRFEIENRSRQEAASSARI
jgi:hypothetical protein